MLQECGLFFMTRDAPSESGNCQRHVPGVVTVVFCMGVLTIVPPGFGSPHPPPPRLSPYPIRHDHRNPSPAAPRPSRRDRHRRGRDRRRWLPRPGWNRLPGHRSQHDPGLRSERRHRAPDGVLVRRAGRPVPAFRRHLRVCAAGAHRRGGLRGGVGGVVRVGGGGGAVRHGVRSLLRALPGADAAAGGQRASAVAGQPPRAGRLRALRGGLLRVASDPGWRWGDASGRRWGRWWCWSC